MALELDDTSILNILLDAVAERLKLKLLTEPVDDAKAGLVRTGKLQDDPNAKKVNILVHPGGKDHPDLINTDTVGTSGMGGTIHEIGGYGSSTYRRRIDVEFQIFYSQEANRNTARMKANVAASRALHAIMTFPFESIPADSFGEHAYAVQVTQMYLFEGGGEGDFNWRGEMQIEFMTNHEPTED
jgi:hypothetical protein